MFDLRNNGGGSLQTVVDMAGYFIEEGPIVQVKSTGGQKQILADEDPNVEWEGPLVVMVNEFSFQLLKFWLLRCKTTNVPSFWEASKPTGKVQYKT